MAAVIGQAASKHGALPPAAADGKAFAALVLEAQASLALAGCSGSAVKIIDGRRACNVPLWLDPPSLAAPGAKQ